LFDGFAPHHGLLLCFTAGSSSCSPGGSSTGSSSGCSPELQAMLNQELQSYRNNHTADSAKLCAHCHTQLVDWMVKAAHSTELQLEDGTLHLAGVLTLKVPHQMHACMQDSPAPVCVQVPVRRVGNNHAALLLVSCT
jgi:hypothetical protein